MKQIISILTVLLLMVTVAIPVNSNSTPVAVSRPSWQISTPDELPVPTSATEAFITVQPTEAPTMVQSIEVKEEVIVLPTEPTASYFDEECSDYDDYDLDLLARLIYVEAGCYWIPTEIKMYVGSVVLNRVNSPLYPNTIEGVIYDEGQYCPENLYLDYPSQEVIEIARNLLENGSVLPADVLGQNGDATGSSIYDIYYDPVLDNTIYFTYVY